MRTALLIQVHTLLKVMVSTKPTQRECFIDCLNEDMMHTKLRALVIPYSGNPKVRYDNDFSLGVYIININCVAMILPLLGLL